ncbi:hypothetical protein, partial [Nocardioides massiliensis]
MTLALPVEATRSDVSPAKPRVGASVDDTLRLDLRAPGPALLVSLLALVAAQAVVILDVDVPVLRAAIAVTTMVVLPTVVLVRRARLPSDSAVARWGYAFGLSLLAVMLVSLAVNSIALALGFEQVLTAPVLGVTWLVLDAALLCWRSSVPLVVIPAARTLVRRTWDLRAEPAHVLACLALPSAILGAIRLNNGADGDVALVSHVLVLAAFAVLLVRRGTAGRDLRVLYLSALALLLATSLRGWGVTGHDIQAEYGVFRLTQDAGHWSMDLMQNAYTACLSITILPVALAETTGLSGTIWFTVGLQVVFAAVPALAYLVYRRFVPQRLALVAVLFVVAFPTFHVDMPYLVRQEIAFLFVVLLLLVATDRGAPVRMRRVLAVVFGVGVIVSHYSTTYLLLLALGGGLVLYGLAALVTRRRRTPDRPPLVLLHPLVVAAVAG